MKRKELDIREDDEEENDTNNHCICKEGKKQNLVEKLSNVNLG